MGGLVWDGFLHGYLTRDCSREAGCGCAAAQRISGAWHHWGMPVEALEVVAHRGWLGHLSLAPQALLCHAIPRRGWLFVAPSQLVMSVLKTLVHFSKCFEPVSICPVTSASSQAPYAEQDSSADSLLTMFDPHSVVC